MLQAVGQKARLVLAHQHRHAAAAAHEGAQPVGLCRVGVRPAHHLDKRHQVGWHEKVQAEHAAARVQPLRNRADRKARTVAGEHGGGGRELHQFAKQMLLHGQVFRNALDQQDGIGP